MTKRQHIRRKSRKTTEKRLRFNGKNGNQQTKDKLETNLPEDLLVEILSRVPATSLARLQLVSKGWKTLMKDESLVKKQSAYALRQSSLALMLIDFRVYLASFDLRGIDENTVKVTSQFRLQDPLSNPSKEVDIREVFHCDGLLLCITKDNMLVVWNPCSGETRWMIKPKDSYENFGFYALGKSSCNKYKILRMDQHGNGFMGPCLVEYEIYDFSSNSWRSVGNTRDWAFQGHHRRGMSVNGNTYWIAFNFSHQDAPMNKKFLISFDFSTERFTSVSLPLDLSPDREVMALSVTREEKKLCLLASRVYYTFDIDVWMATKVESTGAMAWSKFLTVERDVYRQFFIFCNGMNFLADTENKVLVCPGKRGNSNKFLHIMGEDKCIQVDGQEHEGSIGSLLVSYVPTLVQIEQASLGVGARKAPIT